MKDEQLNGEAQTNIEPTQLTTDTEPKVDVTVQEDVVVTKAGILSQLKTMLEGGQINKAQLANMRRDLGFTQADFTRKQTTKAQRKNTRKIQKAGRKANH